MYKTLYDAGVRTTCFISPIFPGISDVEAIIERVKNQYNLIWLENLNLSGSSENYLNEHLGERKRRLTFSNHRPTKRS